MESEKYSRWLKISERNHIIKEHLRTNVWTLPRRYKCALIAKKVNAVIAFSTQKSERQGKEKMKIVQPSYEILTPINGVAILKHIENCGRICYKSEHKITDESYRNFVVHIVRREHYAVLEHFSISVKFICDRGISHEIVRHRMASYCQESTRYCNYSKDAFQGEISVIEPLYLEEGTKGYRIWQGACQSAENAYFDLLNFGCTPQEARAVLPTSLKTELVMTANLREWLHFLKLRTAKTAHPQIRQLTIPLLEEFQKQIPYVFDDIVIE